MKFGRSIILLLFALALDVRADAPLVDATIVIYNKAVPDSVQLAKFYAEQRGIARDHVIALACSTEEEISREEYDTTIAEPLRNIFKERQWWQLRDTAEHSIASSSIHFVALIKGMPLKIRSMAAPYPGDQPGPGPILDRTEASVDSELATLANPSRQISGPANNPYFKSFGAIGNFPDATQLLVCRLDAPTVAAVKQMIVNAIAAEKNGLWGRAYIDGSHNTSPGMDVADKWLATIVEQLHKVGIPEVYDDSPAIFPDGYPMTDCALYYGWYAQDVTGPFNNPGFHFAPGAIAVHIHSFSASTLRDPSKGWVGPLITRGATASIGNVYEPYLQITANLEMFNDRLLHGLTLAESAYASLPALSWMAVVVGDPLYRPYSAWLQLDSAKSAANWQMYHDFAVKYYPNSSAQYRQLARQAAMRAKNCPMLEDLGLMEASDGNFAAAVSYFQQARACYGTRDDIMRVVLEEVNALVRQNKSKRALELVRSVLRIVNDAPLLRKVEQDLGGASTAPKRP